jgi:DNA-binding NarL/FixJ family response regulator
MTEPPARPTTSPSRSSRPRDRTILVVDRHVTFAEALACVLNDVPGLRAVAATTFEAAHRALAEREVDMVLLEIDLPGNDGLRLVRQIFPKHPGLRIAAVTSSEDENLMIDAVRAGVSAWILKDEPVEHLVSAVHGVLCGETRIPPQFLTRVIAGLTSAQRNAAAHDQLLTTLTKREREVLDFLVWGLSMDEIVQRLCLSRNTLRTHIRNILRKLNVHSKLAAVALARKAG